MYRTIIFLKMTIFHLAPHLSLAQDNNNNNNYIECFDNIRQNLQWPLGSPSHESSTIFGPIIGKDGEYTFSRSSIINGNDSSNNSAHAVYDGKVVLMDDLLSVSDDTHTVILQHELPESMVCRHGGEEFRSFFTVYANLLKSDLQEEEVFEGKVFVAGEKIGLLARGEDGEMTPSLRFQVRLGIDFCVDNESDCGPYGQPVHPHLVRPQFQSDDSYILERNDESSDDDLVVTISTSQNDIIQYDIHCRLGNHDKIEIDEAFHALNVDTREGFYPIPELYEQHTTVPYIQPVNGKMNHIVVPKSWFSVSTKTECCSVSVRGISGSVQSRVFCGDVNDDIKNLRGVSQS